MADNGVGGNNTQTDNSSSGGNDDNTELFLAITALVISVAAFVVSILQALQQYYSSARGYSSCSPRVIGKWAMFRHRRIRWYEFRFEVRFEVPVIFVARPSNEFGPMGHTTKSKIIFLDGSQQSYLDSCTQSRVEHDTERKKQNQDNRGVHTADNEAATWLGLLMAIQRMEDESRKWQSRALERHNSGAVGEQQWPPAPYGGHNLTVCIQRKKKSWDTIPDNITKPYATTTIAHLVEFTAMLGVYWKVFDRSDDRYLAQGNGFILSGSNVEGLGLTFSFQKKGPTWFEDNRVVPHYDVKELCFGLCPTTFRLPGEKQYADEPKGVGTLQLGSMDEIAESLVVLGCNVRAVNLFRKRDVEARHGHLFPIAFELLGMIGIVFQVEGTVFRTLPNPTIFRWDPKSFDLLALLHEYDRGLSEIKPADDREIREVGVAPRQDEAIHALLGTILKRFAEWNDLKNSETASGKTARTVPEPDVKSGLGENKSFVTTRDIEHQGTSLARRRWPLSKTDSQLKTTPLPPKAEVPIAPNAVYLPAIFEALHAAIKSCDEYLEPQNGTAPGSLLRQVLRSHLQVILDTINRKPDPDNDITQERGDSDDISHKKHHAPTIQELDAASDHKHRLLMDMYFHSVREDVVKRVCDRLQRPTSAVNSGSPTAWQSAGFAAEIARQSRKELEQKLSDVWCTLVFRMLCWLLLHHFHEKDVQVEKSDVYESRAPVYLT
ncbi:hypothetical protein B0T25DRAFT_536827 [Lasiosphaeria hispida]|uniref:Modin n=1 Tax=Lasiosphaeria hispida TaxID=260671 RepID=A0AAJ0MFI3_9PEZI|nr:hypothetical protein B0T25DRAFT_536827 [Lasiosphaeria hispida]